MQPFWFSFGNKFFRRFFHPKMALTHLPLVVILGATGTGKSKLAVSLARHFGGEVINGDAMQVYQGLDILTNKIPEVEQMGCPHHLMGFLHPLKRFSVVDFRNRCLPIVKDLQDNGKMPVLVGGTHYYLESVLWNVLMEQEQSSDTDLILDTFGRTILTDPPKLVTDLGSDSVSVEGYSWKALLDPEVHFALTSSADLYALLVKVDPEAARILHPNDKRKIMRSLQVFAQHGKTHSNLIESQKTQAGGSNLGGSLRLPDAIMIWLQCDQEVLDKRLDDRVEEMISAGLVQELLEFRQNLPVDSSPDYTKGIFQSIGLRELHRYLGYSANDQQSEAGITMLRIGIDDMKRQTRKYSRKQVRWINNRFLKRADRQLPLVFGLDATDLSKWDDVEKAAISIVDDLMYNRQPAMQSLKQEATMPDIRVKNHCYTCDRDFVSLSQWKDHLSGNTHKRKRSRQLKLEKSVAHHKEKPSALAVISV